MRARRHGAGDAPHHAEAETGRRPEAAATALGPREADAQEHLARRRGGADLQGARDRPGLRLLDHRAQGQAHQSGVPPRDLGPGLDLHRGRLPPDLGEELVEVDRVLLDLALAEGEEGPAGLQRGSERRGQARELLDEPGGSARPTAHEGEPLAQLEQRAHHVLEAAGGGGPGQRHFQGALGAAHGLQGGRQLERSREDTGHGADVGQGVLAGTRGVGVVVEGEEALEPAGREHGYHQCRRQGRVLAVEGLAEVQVVGRARGSAAWGRGPRPPSRAASRWPRRAGGRPAGPAARPHAGDAGPPEEEGARGSRPPPRPAAQAPGRAIRRGPCRPGPPGPRPPSSRGRGRGPAPGPAPPAGR